MQIAFVTYPGLTALDMIGPYEVLRVLPGAEVRFVWHETGPVATDSGVLFVGATHTFGETSSPDIVLVPGSANSTLRAARDKELLSWLRAVHETSQYTLSVCSGSIILAAAGILQGKRATSHWRALDLLRPFGVHPEPQARIVQEGKITTAAGVSAGIDLALFMAGEIAGAEYAQAIQLVTEYDPQPPFDSGHTGKASAATKIRANAIMVKHGMFKPSELNAATGLLWDATLLRARVSRKRRSGKQKEKLKVSDTALTQQIELS
ncbi:DJ-1/PfpI family protein [Mycobacteroides abscessus]|uniref:DJ-1/PfpI family protein n=1 Tax=Mycobacteroides abscessus TaxID=36809 RepID=UPI000C26A0EC|nr:DJ-1/PfpI family protein [Mycobacteroides abscessus]